MFILFASALLLAACSSDGSREAEDAGEASCRPEGPYECLELPCCRGLGCYVRDGAGLGCWPPAGSACTPWSLVCNAEVACCSTGGYVLTCRREGGDEHPHCWESGSGRADGGLDASR